MISGDLKALDSTPRSSLPFSWNSDGDSGLPPAGPSGGAAFLQHLDTARSAHSQATGSAPQPESPTYHERELPSEAPSRAVSLPPAVQQSARPLVKPSRKAASPPRAMIQAKARFVGASADSATTYHGVGAAPSAIAGLLSCENPQAKSPRLDSELLSRPLPAAAIHTRTEWEHGLPQRPLMESPRSTESKIAWSQEGSSEHHPSAGSLRPANDTTIRPLPTGLPTAARAAISSPAWASPSNPDSEGYAPFASVPDEVPTKLSVEAHAGASTSEILASAANGSAIVVAALDRANRAPRLAGAMEALSPNASSSSSTALDPSDLKHPISSEVRDAARRAVAQSRILELPSISGPAVRHANNDAFRSLVLDPSTRDAASFNSELVPAVAEGFGKSDARHDAESPLALGQVSVSLRPLTASLTSETSAQAALESNRRAPVPSGIPDPDLDPFRHRISTTHPTPSRSNESLSSGLGDVSLESVPPESAENLGQFGKSTVTVAAAESGFQSMQRVESGRQDVGFIQREKNSLPPGSESLASASTTGDFELSSFIDSSRTISQSQPQPSEPSFRSAMRSAQARNPSSAAFHETATVSLDSEKGLPTLLEPKQGTEGSVTSDSLAQGGGSDSPSSPSPDGSQGVVDPTSLPFPGAPQGGPIQERLDGRIDTPSKPREANPSVPVLHETPKPGAVRLVQLDSPGSGGLELRIQEVGEKLIIRTQDLVGSLEGQSAEWKELQQRLEISGVVLMPIERPLSGIATPIESQSVSTDSRHTVCYDGTMGSSGRDGSDPRSSSGRARVPDESVHMDSSESLDESMKSAEALPVSRQWWA